MKRRLWDGVEWVVDALDAVIGTLWRRVVRPHSGSITEHLRIIRFLFRFYRFDTRGSRCALGRNVRFFGSVRVHIGDRGALFDDVIISGVGEVRIGAGSSIGDGSTIVARHLVEIGRDVMVAGRCYILDVDHGIEAEGAPIRDQELTVSPVRIGDDVWLGAYVVVLRGVTIGDGAVIGANSVVAGDIPAGAIAVGSPAKVVRYREPGEGHTGTNA